jgi:translation initiation factor 5B
MTTINPLNKRKCIICIRGHVDTGKTSLIDKLSSHSTSVSKRALTGSEAGGITQQVGTTTFGRDHLVQFIPENLRDKFNMDFVAIDTPGHTDFENIRRIGTSIANICIVMIDICKGIDEDTLAFLESNIKTNLDYDRTILVLNKVDKTYGYVKMDNVNKGHANIKRIMTKQPKIVIDNIEEYIEQTKIQLAKIGLYGEPYYNKKCRECLAMIPCSAITGDGIPDLLLYMSNAKLQLDKSTKRDPQGYILDKRVDDRMGKIIIGIMKHGEITNSHSIKIGSSIFPINCLMRTVGYSDSREHKFENSTVVDEAISFCFKVDSSLHDLIELGSEFSLSTESEKHIDDSAYDKLDAKREAILSDYGVHIILPADSMLDGLHEHFNQKQIPIQSYSIMQMSKQDIIKYINKKCDISNIPDYNQRYRIIMLCKPDMVDNPNKTISQIDILTDYFKPNKLQMLNAAGIKFIIGGTIYKLSSAFDEHLKQHKEHMISKYGSQPTFEAEVIPEYIFRTEDPIICGIKLKSGTIIPNTEIYSSDKSKYYGKVSSIQLDKKDINVVYPDMEVCLRLTCGTHQIIKGQTTIFRNKTDFSHKISELVCKDILSTRPKPSIPKVDVVQAAEVVETKSAKTKGDKFNKSDKSNKSNKSNKFNKSDKSKSNQIESDLEDDNELSIIQKSIRQSQKTKPKTKTK